LLYTLVAKHDLTLVDRSVVPRMPWHDVTLATVGPMARDISRHFIQRWNYLKATKSMHRQNLPFLLPKGEYVAARDESKFKGTCRVQALRSSAQWSSGVEREVSRKI
jgi:phospholipase D1/2